MISIPPSLSVLYYLLLCENESMVLIMYMKKLQNPELMCLFSKLDILVLTPFWCPGVRAQIIKSVRLGTSSRTLDCCWAAENSPDGANIWELADLYYVS